MNRKYVSNRVAGIDYLRIIACFLVVLYHVPHCTNYENVGFNDFFSHGIYTLCFYIGRLAVPLFFIISGYLLFPSKEEIRPFIRKRLERVLFPTLFWMMVFFFLGVPLDEGVVNLPYIQRCQHLWYMFALIGVYLTIPLLSPWFIRASDKDIILVIVLWIITLFYPIINSFTPIELQYSHTGMLFSTPYHSLLNFSGYFGFVLVGGCIKRFLNVIAMNSMWVCSSLFLTSVIVYAFSLIIHVENEDAYAYLSIPTAFISVIVFIFFVTTFKKDVSPFVVDVSNLTFGIYLIHPLLLEQFDITTLGGYSRLLIAVLAFFVSCLIIKIISLIPYNKYIIG